MSGRAEQTALEEDGDTCDDEAPDRATWQAELDALRVREKAHTRVYGRQEPWADSPPGRPQQHDYTRTNGRPIAQWSRLEAERSDDLGTARRWPDPGVARRKDPGASAS